MALSELYLSLFYCVIVGERLPYSEMSAQFST
ncbi:uncharacterized protein METZ01_LOCUS458635, partial [marine metagenome]